MKNFNATKSEKQIHRNELRKVKLSVYILWKLGQLCGQLKEKHKNEIKLHRCTLQKCSIYFLLV